jgi:hypothetical protein
MATDASPFSRPPQPRPPVGRGAAYAAPAPAAPPRGPAAEASPASADRVQGDETLEAQRRSGGQWFYWIAALSSINAVLALAGQQWHFILGLGMTQLIQELAEGSAGAGLKAGVISFAVIGFFAFLGKRAIHGYGWAFVVGMVAYGLDGLLFLLVQDWVGVGFHAFAIAMIMRGYMAARQLPAPTA